ADVVLAVAKCPFTVFPGLTPKDAGQGDEEPIRVKMLVDLLPQRFGHLGSGFQRMQVRVVMEDARGDSSERRQDQVGFGRMKIAAGRIHPQSPRVSGNGLPAGKSERQLKESADGLAGKILEGVASPFIQSQV